MKVAYIGYPKTGTKTIAAALRILGYEVYDYEENYVYLGKKWDKILRQGGSREDFIKMYEDVDATVDTPVFFYWKELLDAFPDIKFVACYRPEEDFVRSWFGQIKKMEDINLFVKALLLLSPTTVKFGNYSRLLSRVCFGGYEITSPWKWYTGITPQTLVKRFNQHNLEISQKVPKKNLLEMSLSDGWEPLCEFLKKPVPDVPFPHKNKQGALVQHALDFSPVFAQAKRELKIILFLLVALLSFVLYFVFC